MVWYGMTSDKIVDPLVLCNTMNAERYFTMLKDKIWPIISTWDNIEV